MRLRPGFYNLFYRFNMAPWDKQVRPELVELVGDGRLSPDRQQSVLDLGCGTGAEVVFLAEKGFKHVVGVDFSAVAIRKARARAEAAGVAERCRFVLADVTGPTVPEVEDSYDLILDFGALNDTEGEQRRKVADVIRRMSHPGSVVLAFCFSGNKEELPALARLTPMLAPGEEAALFADHFDIEHLPSRDRTVSLLLTRR